MPGPAHCPDRAALQRFADDGDPALDAHVAGCDRCRRLVQRIRQDNELAREAAAFARAAQPIRPSGQPPTDSSGGGQTDPHAPTREGRGPRGGTHGGWTADLGDAFEVRREIHRGSQGIVVEAWHRPTHRAVAVKTLLAGSLATSRQRARFEREVELAASLRHPSIVTVHDSGADAAGQPYIVMELIDGVPLDEHIRSLTPDSAPGPPVEAVLALFEQVCDAVHFAHLRGIIHRDLKPSNILVTADGRPHVLDFGIARLAGRPLRDSLVLTQAGGFLGTPAYAAPEQLTAGPDEVDVRADVYALGVLMYEALAGRRPHNLEGSLADVVHRLTQTDPPPASRLRPDLDADITAMLARALQRDPRDRYESAGQLAEEIRRYRQGLPLEARRGSRWYVARKTIVRHRVAFGSGAAAVLILGAVLATILSMHLRTAEAEQAKGLTLDALLTAITQLNQEESNVRISTLPEFLDEAARIVAERLAAFPRERAMVEGALATAFMNRGEHARAVELARSSLALRLDHRMGEVQVAEGHSILGRTLWASGDYPGAAEAFGTALDLRRSALSPGHADVPRTMLDLAGTMLRAGRTAAAERIYLECGELMEKIHGRNSPEMAAVLNGLSMCHREQGRPAEALAAAQESLSIIEESAGREDWRAARALGNVATYLIAMEDYDAAAEALRRSLAIKRQWRGADDADIARTLDRFASLVRSKVEAGVSADPEADLLEGETYASQAILAYRSTFDRAHPDLANALSVMGVLKLLRDRPDEAEPFLQEALGMRRQTLPANNWRVGLSESLLGECLTRAGRFEEALPLLLTGLETIQHERGPDDARTLEAVQRLHDFYIRIGDDAAAEQTARRLERTGSPP